MIEEAVMPSMSPSLFHQFLLLLFFSFSPTGSAISARAVIGRRLHTDVVKCLFPPGNVMVQRFRLISLFLSEILLTQIGPPKHPSPAPWPIQASVFPGKGRACPFKKKKKYIYI